MTEVSQQITYDKTYYNLYQRLLVNLLTKIKSGGITLRDSDQEIFFGDPQHKLQAAINIQSDAVYSAIFWGGAIGFAEQYILDTVRTDDLTTLLRIFALNLKVVDKVDRSIWGYLLRVVTNCVHFVNRNSVSGAKKNIAKHYDLGNNFFEQFLDPTMMYSAAKFTDANCSLEQASINKIRILCEKLQLTKTDHLLEIGSGWGYLAIYAAKNYGCKVTTTTISKEQYEYVRQQVCNNGLQQQITVLMQDYRELQGQYDKLVSVEMIEAVGHQYLGVYLQQCSRLLKNNGIFVLQAITISEQNYMAAKNSVDFIKKYIFPGGFLPSVGEITKYIRSHTDFNILDLEDLTLDYAKTLQVWRFNCEHNKNKILSQGFDKTFFRKWIYYLCYCEAGFLERNISALQIVFSKPGYRDNSYYDY